MSKEEQYILALDQGTTTSRSILFNRSGAALAISQKPFKQLYPHPGWVEHDPEEIWRTQLEVAQEVLKKAQIGPEQVQAIGITNQRETVVLWERASGKPVYNAIVWQCRRSSEICHELKAMGLEERIREKTGLLLDPYFSATKLMWLLQDRKDLRTRAERGELMFGTIDSWLLYKLSGQHRTDVSNASRTMLFNIHTLEWDKELLEIFRIPESLLPEVLPSSAKFGESKAELLGRAIPICSCVGDQQAALFGHACFEPGSVKNTYGTGCFTLLNTGTSAPLSRNRLLTTIAWQLDGKTTYALEGSVFIGGAVVQWLRDELGMIQQATETEALCESVPDTGGVVIVPAFVGLGAPWWDSEARGAVLGITRGTSRAHLVRAAIESIAYQSMDLVRAMEADYGQPILELKADGGASANSFLMCFQADLLNRQVVLPETGEITALGAAYLAGLESGYWKDQKEIALNWRARRRFMPQCCTEEREQMLSRWEQAVRATRSFLPGQDSM
jgi:glycerol kinase